MFKNLKGKLVKKLIKSKLKGMNLPPDQEEMIITMVLENPELFQKIGQKIEQKTKQGMNQQAAMMQVFREHQDELQGLMGNKMPGGGGAPRPPMN